MNALTQIAMAVTLAVAVCLAGCDGQTANKISLSASAPPAVDRIVYVSTAKGNKDIYSINPDGSDVQQLTDAIDSDVEPCWSPNGKYIAFAREAGDTAEIFIMNADGTQPQQLTSHHSIASAPAWSPDGKQIAYGLWSGNDWEIFVADLNGGATQNITATPTTDSYPDWSPNGARLAFHCQKNQDDWNIFVIERDGSGRRRLTSETTKNWLPAWSPDGKQIAFWSTRTGQWQLFLMKPDGLEQRQISREPGNVKGWISRPAWSPDGSSLIISCYGDDGHQDLYKISVDGEEKVRLTDAVGDDADPDWSQASDVN